MQQPSLARDQPGQSKASTDGGPGLNQRRSLAKSTLPAISDQQHGNRRMRSSPLMTVADIWPVCHTFPAEGQRW